MALVISVLAVMGLAYTFGVGHGLIDNYATSRAALGEAQRRMEWLSALPVSSDSLQLNGPHPVPAGTFSIPGVVSGTYQWTVSDYDDPATPTPDDLKLVTLQVVYPLGRALDTLQTSRLFQRAH